MNVLGYEVTEEQQRVCLALMTNIFKLQDVRTAAVLAGVPERWQAVGSARDEDLAELVARRIIRRQIHAGVVLEDGRIYRAVNSA